MKLWRWCTIVGLSEMTATTTHEAPSNARMNGVLFLLSLSVLINYIDRSNLSIAAELIKHEIHISDFQLGTLLSAFFWTYALMQIPAGWLVDRFDVKWVFAAGFLLWSASTAVTGLLHGFAALLIIRVILGLGESVAFPSYGKVLGSYFKERHRGFANAMIMVGLALGPALGMWVGGRAVGRFGWRPFFLMLGLAGLLWLPLWAVWMPASYRHALPVRSANRGLSRHSTATILVGHLHRAGFHQLLPVFSGDMATLLPAAGAPPYPARRGQRWRPALPRFRDFLGSDWKTLGPVDPRGRLPHSGAQRLDAVRPHGNRHLPRHHSAGVRPPLHSDARSDRSVSGNQRLQQLGDLADAGWTPNGRAVDRGAEFRG